MSVVPDIPFDDVYREYRPRIYRFLSSLVGNHEAEDLTQDIFVKVSKSLPSFHGDSHIATWLYRIATNTALDRLKSSSYRKEAGSLNLDAIAETAHDRNVWTKGRSKSPDDLLIRKEMSECVRSIIDTLPEKDRMVIVLSEGEGFADHEIAEILNLKVGAVKVRLHRARARLREKLESACDFYRTKDNTLACDKKPPILPFRSSDRKQ
jgi:RNA polymerase sigma-70 factor (ECF subfamily)